MKVRRCWGIGNRSAPIDCATKCSDERWKRERVLQRWKYLSFTNRTRKSGRRSGSAGESGRNEKIHLKEDQFEAISAKR